MGYADHLRSLLRPLGVYELSAESLSGGELEALGAAFDALYESIQNDLRESLPVTASREGLAAYEKLFMLPTQTIPSRLRREAIMGLLRMRAGNGSVASMQQVLEALGLRPSFDESELPERLTVALAIQNPLSPEFLRLRAYLDTLLPCHLTVSYRMTG